VIEKTSELSVDIEKGMKDGSKIVYYSEGDASPSKRAGDLIFVIKTAPHERFIRDKLHLKTSMVITLKQALVGFSREITHLDGHVVTVTSDRVIKPGDVQVIKGQGMPSIEDSSKHGDLFITYDVLFPASLTKSQKEELEKTL
jgi:DnaJ-class molecular chaperone